MKLLLAICLALLLPLTAQAQGRAQGTTRWVKFADPTDQAFSVDVPAGWTVLGGIAHRRGGDLSWYVTAVSPDGEITLRLGDPEVGVIAATPAATPAKSALSQAPQTKDQLAKGQAVKGPPARSQNPMAVGRPYETGTEFAASYATTVASQLHLCKPPKLIGSQEEPNPPGYTAELGQRVTTGDIFLLCVERGYVGYVIATTVLAAPPFDSWNVPRLAALAAPTARRAEAMDLLRHMADSWAFTPGWLQKMGAAEGPLARQLAALGKPPPAGERERWNGRLDTADAAALKRIDGFMGNATALCDADGKIPAPHQCGETGHPRGR